MVRDIERPVVLLTTDFLFFLANITADRYSSWSLMRIQTGSMALEFRCRYAVSTVVVWYCYDAPVRQHNINPPSKQDK